MALDLIGIRKALADNARSAAGLDDVKHYRPDTAQSGTSFWVETVGYRPSTFGRTRWTVDIEGHLLVQGAWDRSKQEAVDELVPLVWTALETDRTLDGYAQTMTVLSVLVLRDVDDGSPLGARFEIVVEA